MHSIDFKLELQQLRNSYVLATPKQRINVIRQRLGDDAHGPGSLVTYVSAVESLSRSLLLHCSAPSPSYEDLKHKKPDELIRLFLNRHGLGDPGVHFGEDVWNQFLVAVEFRNLLVHECTYLGLEKHRPLEIACMSVFRFLEAYVDRDYEA